MNTMMYTKMTKVVDASANEVTTASATRYGLIDAIQQRIAAGVLRPNQPLQEVELAQEFNVSRTPVREALLQLESLGAVVRRKAGGLVVAGITAEAVGQALRIREQLEVLALEWSCPKISESKLLGAEASYEAARRAMLAGNASDYARWHRKFHEQLYSACGSALLLTFISACRHHSMDYQLVRMYSSREWKAQVEIDRRLLGAVRNRDTLLARRMLRRACRGAMAIASRRLS
jgi:DNA-binding GntR family transcriptional regulator